MKTEDALRDLTDVSDVLDELQAQEDAARMDREGRAETAHLLGAAVSELRAREISDGRVLHEISDEDLMGVVRQTLPDLLASLRPRQLATETPEERERQEIRDICDAAFTAHQKAAAAYKERQQRQRRRDLLASLSPPETAKERS